MSDPKYINELDLRREIRALPDYGELWRTAMKRFLDCIDEVRPADVVKVLRCKDCQYAKPHNDEFWIEEAPLLCDLFDIYVGGDDYCSMGERKDD